MWILGPGSSRVIGLFESHMQASTIMLTNESSTSTVQIPYVAHVKLEPTDDSVLVLSDSKDDICAFVDLSNTSSFPIKSVHSTPSQLPIHVAKSPCGSMYRRSVPQISHSQCPPLHPLPSYVGLTIVDALKLRYSRKKIKIRSRIH